MLRLKEVVRIRQVLAEHNITILQFEILLAVELNEGSTLSDIMGRGFLPTSSTIATISSPIQRLAEGTPRTPGRGLVKKEPSPHHKNASLLYLTKDGREVLEDIKNKLDYK
ncbi:MarR family winged helix-turn-helix transcriptional regulator [Spartinivicinus ruber]|uniref:MarR family winged helix-turn-helix transcriptional regulator n=1 Tax=Spartinivicinus ruber TaxID=2683272 RepID=UPI0013D7D1AB|nr:MarR family winged helix-turn-helix transcriptional regulator [Spartinivicinus ruber]